MLKKEFGDLRGIDFIYRYIKSKLFCQFENRVYRLLLAVLQSNLF